MLTHAGINSSYFLWPTILHWTTFLLCLSSLTHIDPLWHQLVLFSLTHHLVLDYISAMLELSHTCWPTLASTHPIFFDPPSCIGLYISVVLQLSHTCWPDPCWHLLSLFLDSFDPLLCSLLSGWLSTSLLCLSSLICWLTWVSKLFFWPSALCFVIVLTLHHFSATVILTHVDPGCGVSSHSSQISLTQGHAFCHLVDRVSDLPQCSFTLAHFLH